MENKIREIMDTYCRKLHAAIENAEDQDLPKYCDCIRVLGHLCSTENWLYKLKKEKEENNGNQRKESRAGHPAKHT